MLVKSKACLKYISVPPRKMRLVGNMVKGMPVEKALNILNFTPRIAAHHIAKTLKSAASNALSLEGTDHLKPEDLLVKNIIVDAAPTAKRIRFQSMGRAFRYRKRFCHLTILIEGQMDMTVESKPVKAKKTVVDKTKTKGKKAAPKKKKIIKKTAKRKNTLEKKAVVKSAVTKKKIVARKKTD